MSLRSRAPQNDSDDWDDVPVGTHIGICFRLVDIGTHHNEMFDSYAEKVIIGWETPQETDSNGKPLIIHAWLTNSLSRKATLRAWLEAWRGRPFTKEELDGFDLTQIVGKACMLNVGDTESGKRRVNTVMALPKGTQAPSLYNTPHLFDRETGDLSQQAEWIQNQVKKSLEFQGLERPAKKRNEPIKEPVKTEEDFDDDIPF